MSEGIAYRQKPDRNIQIQVCYLQWLLLLTERKKLVSNALLTWPFLIGDKKTDQPGKDYPQQYSTTPKKIERPKSLTLHTLSVDPPVIRESPEFAADKVFTDHDKAVTSANKDKLPSPTRSPKARESSKDLDTDPEVKFKYSAVLIPQKFDLFEKKWLPFQSDSNFTTSFPNLMII